MTSSSTRNKHRHSVFGFPKELAKNLLPTREDVFRAYCSYQKKEKSVNDIAKAVANDVIKLYVSANIPAIAFDSVVKKIKRLIEKGNDLRKYPEAKRTSGTYQDALSSFGSLFDICLCKCVDAGIVNRKDCKCPVECKIPVTEWNFWVDHKTAKTMVGKIDEVAIEKLQKFESRKQKAAKFEPNTRRKMSESSSVSKEWRLEYSSEDKDIDDIDDCYIQIEDTEDEDSNNQSCSECGPQNKNKYPELRKAIDRANVSSRDGCLVANAILKDLGLLTSENFLHPSKLCHQRSAWRKNSVEDHNEKTKGIVCRGFGGRVNRKKERNIKDVSALK